MNAFNASRFHFHIGGRFTMRTSLKNELGGYIQWFFSLSLISNSNQREVIELDYVTQKFNQTVASVIRVIKLKKKKISYVGSVEKI